MKQETKSKRKAVYYIVLAVGVLLLAAATVLTVYFVTKGNRNTLQEDPPVVEPDEPSGPVEPTPDDPVEPSLGDNVRFVSPIENAACKVDFNTVYVNETLRWAYYHKALDYDAEVGTAVRAIGEGTVETVSCDEFTGNLIVIDHGDDLRSYYRFVEPVEGLKKGDKVTQGQTIGTVAEAYGIERFDGVHLHFEMRSGKDFVNPTNYLDAILEEK